MAMPDEQVFSGAAQGAPSPEAKPWSTAVAREIALRETGVPDADLDDALGGPRLHMYLQEVRDGYVAACCRTAKKAGHTVADPSSIPAKESTTVMEVSDAL
jgi:hypothetical protein